MGPGPRGPRGGMGYEFINWLCIVLVMVMF
jgi:hypothetical protein